MKVLLINNLYGRYARGGAERVVDSIVEGLYALGHEPVVLTAGPFRWRWFLWPRIDPTESTRTYRFYPNNIFSIVTINKRPKWLRAIWHIIDAVNDHPAWVLWWIIKREKPDIVWTHNLKGLGVYIPMVIRLLRIRHVHHLHDVQLLEPSGLLFGESRVRGKEGWLSSVARGVREMLRRVYVRWNRSRIGSPSFVVSPTRWLLQLHQQHGFFKKSKTLVLSHPTPSCPVRVARFDRDTRSPGAARDDRKINFLFAGQLAEHKGTRFLVDALKTTELPFLWELHIAGVGALELELRSTLADDPRFIFHGKLSAEPFEDVWSQTDLTIVPSLCLENAPTVILESLARGIPVLASRVGGIPEMVKEEENGWLFIAGDRENFLQTLLAVYHRIRAGFLSFHQDIKSPAHYVEGILSFRS